MAITRSGKMISMRPSSLTRTENDGPDTVISPVVLFLVVVVVIAMHQSSGAPNLPSSNDVLRIARDISLTLTLLAFDPPLFPTLFASLGRKQIPLVKKFLFTGGENKFTLTLDTRNYLVRHQSPST
jgi:hypothetical protein